MPFDWRLDWQREDYVRKSGSLARRAAFEARLSKYLSDSGIKLLAGTDAPTIPGIVAGFSLHDDLDRLVAAGFTRFQALAAQPGPLENSLLRPSMKLSRLGR